MNPDDGRGGRRLRRLAASGKQRYFGSWAQDLWARLRAIDFINQGMIFAATLLLCFFPFMLVTDALAGRSAVTGMARRLGLDSQAAAELASLFASSTTTRNAVTGAATVFFCVGGIAAMSTMQQLYQKSFGLPGRGFRDLPHQLLALAVLVGVRPWRHGHRAGCTASADRCFSPSSA
ncbi:hypothetical protein GCM10025734_04860 [Kitasatospora paranensis]|uniref:hypothetical protein n=1 Tax=Kitasatospora paranensis TaxID=258053 RepID=UPI0031F0003C